MHLVDLSVGLHDSDKMLMDALTESQQPFNLVLTKVDKIKNEKEVWPKAEKVIAAIEYEGLLCNPIVHLVSAHSGFGITEFRSDCVFIFDQ